jgi:hypothetical protein
MPERQIGVFRCGIFQRMRIDDARFEFLARIAEHYSSSTALKRQTFAVEFAPGNVKKWKFYINIIGDPAKISQRQPTS